MSGDYFNNTRGSGQPADADRRNAPLPSTPGPQTPGGRRPGGPVSLEGLRAPSSIRIRRLPSAQNVQRPGTQGGAPATAQADTAVTGRRRSSSEPQRYGQTLAPPGIDLARQRTHDMPTITEGQTSSSYPQPAPSESSQDYHEAPETPPRTPSLNIEDATSPAGRVITGASAMTEAGNAARANRGLQRFHTGGSNMRRNENPAANEYRSDVVDLLDLVGMWKSPINKHCNRANST